jgi:hypothetical protein
MNVLRHAVAALCLSLGAALPLSSAHANVSVSIGINVPAYPQLVPVPGYPVYYAPSLATNYFFYDGLYWVFIDGNWYDSAWYNGPWQLVAPEYVPVYVLRVPVRYYRRPPPYFRGWAPNAPPHWGERFGPAWEQQHRGWEHWNHAQAPRPAPLPSYQRQYKGKQYPQAVPQQQALHGEHYRYQPQEPVVQQHYRQMGLQSAPHQPPGHSQPHGEGKGKGQGKGQDKHDERER